MKKATQISQKILINLLNLKFNFLLRKKNLQTIQQKKCKAKCNKGKMEKDKERW